jgi:hypothetical protein
MVPATASSPATLNVFRELSALRDRLEGAPDRCVGSSHTIEIVNLATEVKFLCWHASCSQDPQDAASLLNEISRNLDELQMLLGAH